MEQLVASAKNGEENPTEKYPFSKIKFIKDATNVQGDTPQNSGDVISQVRLYSQ